MDGIKGWFQSKTIWLNVFIGVLLTLSQSSEPFIALFSESVQPTLTTVVAYFGVAANWIMRFFTTVGVELNTPLVAKKPE